MELLNFPNEVAACQQLYLLASEPRVGVRGWNLLMKQGRPWLALACKKVRRERGVHGGGDLDERIGRKLTTWRSGIDGGAQSFKIFEAGYMY